MASDELTLKIRAQTSEFVKAIKDIESKTKVIANQMSEIDKQLKMENVDRVQKLSEKIQALDKMLNLARNETDKYVKTLGLQKQALAEAEKEAAKKKDTLDKLEQEYKDGKISAEEYEKQQKNLTSEYESSQKTVEKVRNSVEMYSEKIKLAEQKSQTLAEQLKQTAEDFEKEKDAASKTGEEIEDLSEEVSDASNSLEDMAKNEEKVSEKTTDVGEEASSSGNKVKDFWEKVKQGVATDLVIKGLSKITGFFADIASKAWNAAKAVASFAKDYANGAVELAAAYQDAVGYSEQVYGKLAEESQKWVEDNSVRLRIYKGDLQRYVNEFGGLFNGFGYGEQQALEMSESLISLAADLRAATGKDINEVIKSLNSGFTSSTKSLQQFGVVTNEAAIKAKALEMGLVNIEHNDLAVEKATLKVTEANKKASTALWKYGEDSLEYQKAQIAITEAEQDLQDALGGTVLELDRTQRTSALLQIVMEDLSFLLGQSDKEADNYNSQLDTMHTIMQNLQEEIGERLLPVYNNFLDKVNEFLQSDAGKAVMDALADAVGILADKVLELLEDEQMTEWISNLKDNVPKVAEKIVEFAEKIGDLIPKVLDLADAALTFFGIGDGADAARARESFIRTKDEVQKFADQSEISLEQAVKAVEAYAKTTDTKSYEIYDDWDTYGPKIMDWYKDLATGADGAAEDYDTAMSKLPESTTENLDALTQKITSFTSSDELRARVRGWADDIVNAAKSAWDWLTKVEDKSSNNNIFNPNNSGYGESHAAGGPVRAGQMYRVNDDHGRRIETFVPAVDGYILNGQDTQRIINNSTNNSRTYGDVNVYVNSYGTDAAAIAEEIGAEVNRKLRMAGAW